MRTLRLVGLILAIIIMANCLPKTKELVKTLWDKDASYVTIVEFKNDPLIPYQHPIALDETLIPKALEALKYQEISFFKWGKPKPIFEPSDIELLGGLLNQALKEASSNQLAEFCLETRRKEFALFPKPYVICGAAFALDNRLHFVFSDLLEEEEKWKEEGRPHDPREIFSLELKRIYAEEPVSYPQVDTQNKMFKTTHYNWAIVDLEALNRVEKPATEMSIEERLQKLKELFEKGLITQEEYEQKKKEILEGL